MTMKTLFIVLVLFVSLAGCTPTVQVMAPREPIEINLNVKIQHDIRIRVDKELEGLSEEDSDVF